MKLKKLKELIASIPDKHDDLEVMLLDFDVDDGSKTYKPIDALHIITHIYGTTTSEEDKEIDGVFFITTSYKEKLREAKKDFIGQKLIMINDALEDLEGFQK